MDDQVILPTHPEHPLVLAREKGEFRCRLCLDLDDLDLDVEWYHCDICGEYFHKECAEMPPEINYPFHTQHPAPFAMVSTRVLKGDWNCLICGKFRCGKLAYRCSMCDFSVGAGCAKNPKETVIDRSKSHGHKLTLMPRMEAFTCDACGEGGRHGPWVCLQCGFMVHKDCTNLPHVIRINRHQHRISHTCFLRPGHSICGVCRQQVDHKYMAYSCSTCSYAVHTSCATSKSVWNGKELEGTPEEMDQLEGVEPFKVIEDGVINHFSHEHNLRLNKHGSIRDESKRCEACVFPIWSDPFYSCIHCHFILHQVCANLPRKKWHPLFPQPLSLHAKDDKGSPSQQIFFCHVCDRAFSGFKYKSDSQFLTNAMDITCGSLSEPFNHQGHPSHSLFFASRYKICKACKKRRVYVLSCIECDDFHLCCSCATLPYRVRHRYDDHPITFHLGEDVSGSCWCEICEEELDPTIRFYVCDKCGFTSHVNCLLGDFLFVKPGHFLEQAFTSYKFEAIENNGASRPFCRICKHRCRSPMFLKCTADAHPDLILCSERCLDELGRQDRLI